MTTGYGVLYIMKFPFLDSFEILVILWENAMIQIQDWAKWVYGFLDSWRNEVDEKWNTCRPLHLVDFCTASLYLPFSIVMRKRFHEN